jgi:two-component system, LytTR family, sensor kinase
MIRQKMIPKRTFLLIWLALMLYAAFQAVLVVRSGNTSFLGVFIGNALTEHVRLGLIVLLLFLAKYHLKALPRGYQVCIYGVWIGIATAAHYGGTIGLVLVWGTNQAFTNILANTQWIVVQYLLENAFIVLATIAFHYQREAQEREERERELRLLNTQMELSALRAQLNPHFLFNALNAVNALVGANPEQARRVLEMLADVLRYTLRSSLQDFVSLREELDFVRIYLAIEQERFGKRLQTLIEVDETLMDAAVAPMLIQPLVENAVNHGIAPKADGGTVTVRVRAIEDAGNQRLCVEVSDDGVGMSGNKTDNHTPSTGIGLANTDARLHKLFGDLSALHIASSDYGLTVTFSIPHTQKTEQP